MLGVNLTFELEWWGEPTVDRWLRDSLKYVRYDDLFNN